MTPDELIGLRGSAWERLTALVRRANPARLRGLSEEELVELGELYRSATSDLAMAQRDFPHHRLATYLNQLVGQAHPVIYQGEPFVLHRLGAFYRSGLPQLYRRLLPFTLVAALLFFGTGIVSYAVVLVNPDTAGYVLAPQTMGAIQSGQQWWKELNGSNQSGAALIMTNNLRVAFYAFAGGILLGLFTVYTLIVNGLSLGMVIGLEQVYGHAGPLLEFVVGHGVLELSEIAMAGGSGLCLAYALLQPGLLSRKDALTAAAQQSIRLLLGTAPLLVVAGLIEGLISPTDAPAVFKYGIGLASGLLLYGYLLLAGRTYHRSRVITRRLRRLLTRA